MTFVEEFPCRSTFNGATITRQGGTWRVVMFHETRGTPHRVYNTCVWTLWGARRQVRAWLGDGALVKVVRP